ncbi:bifunctional 4-hydroxy-2-oxoglutarate aldolase/2-dehydro-3-deoxy-phosphogluconate aldolase [Phycisphaera mikurensis]|uniref:2-dehydro-3-deoxy-phosphogluconate aldolase n=1 Tax=Phycisphaera mikurensis (strain NBRC 102666 / KCTC 22515 / FYK2301M01) TaxID=1142394 RepID=I0II57_PHYMF|nr:bifunctional 4-hydroxy-2-oxoglutarate aldolase/2-dehydro-3-deoxy-phosphogluconate aldolase [Phycisphaera mikurensis]MBB6442492.1 2-dehydro-3-deoxyphosphogluconate aldolase/(4S)-4-hydroxy-2-oxoglutarate aldolase [Phycisphaera mikurensis]BAM04945.1 4-hydroxy-2-oxoglutarate aldolase/2-dehydro-3-deoxy-phosphogluconate [Phycisphaera mikurensis NBRC 102666]
MATPTAPPDPHQDVLDLLARHRLVPVVVLHDAAHAVPLADALEDGGLPVAEVTFRSDAAEACIKAMADRGGIHVGAGTLATAEHVDRAVDAGASFAVTPGFNDAVVERCLERGLPIFPGICTPGDIERARAAGLSTVKFFPAETYGGVPTLEALQGPYPAIRFIPTGGITADNVGSYLRLPSVVACGGSWMVKPALFAGGDFSAVKEAARDAVSAASADGRGAEKDRA